VDIEFLSRFAYSLDGRAEVVTDNDGNVRIRLPDREEPVDLTPLPSPAASVAIAPDGQLAATGGDDGMVRLWTAGTGEFRYGYAQDAPVTRLIFSADGGLLASGDAGGSIMIWDIAGENGVKATLRGHSPVTSLAFSPAGERVAVGTADGQVAAWPLADPESGVSFPAHQVRVFTLVYSPDGQFLVSGGEDGTASSWRAATGEKIADREGESAAVTAAAISTDNRLVATGDEITRLTIWELATGRVDRDLPQSYAGPIAALAYAADGELTGMTGPSPPQQYSISPDGRVTLSPPIGGADLMLSTDGNVIGTPATVAAIGLSSDYHFASAAWSGTVTLWNLRESRLTTEFTTAGGTGQRLAFSPQGDLLAVASEDNTIQVLDVATGACLNTLFFDSQVTAAFAAGPPLTLIVADRAGRVFEYEVASHPARAPGQVT
jgi:WD40 repeat protein